MPNRMLKDSVNESRGLTSCSFFAQDLYKRLITYADDYGRFNADPQIMIARLYPRELDIVCIEDIIDALAELAGVNKISFYTSQGRHNVYGAFPKWSDHQRIRDSKKKAPDPDDTSVNDWYLQRYIPAEMKAAVIERETFKCQICGKRVSEVSDVRRLVKMATGTFYIEPIASCGQGGQATMDNLQLICPKCNLSRRKAFSFDEILSFAEIRGELPQVAASCGELRPETKPNQQETKTETKTETNCRKRQHLASLNEAFDRFWKAYPKKVSKESARKAFVKLDPDEELIEKMIQAIGAARESDQWKKDNGQFIPYPASWINGRRWEDEITTATENQKSVFERMMEGMD